MRLLVAQYVRWPNYLATLRTMLQTNSFSILFSSSLFIVAFLLSKFSLFGTITPFFFPFWAAVYMRYAKYSNASLAGGMIGSAFFGFGQIVIQLLLIGLFRIMHKKISEPMYLPLLVVVAVPVVQIVWQFFSYAGQLSIATLMIVAYETLIASTFSIFLWKLLPPLYGFKKYIWSFERVVSAIVVTSICWWSLDGWLVWDISIALFMSQLLVLLAYYTKGKSKGALVATVIGAISSLTTLAFSGMIAVYALTSVGVLFVNRKSRVAITLAVLTCYGAIMLYDATLPLDKVFFRSFIAAAFIFILLPNKLLKRWIQKDDLEEKEVLLERQEWMNVRMKEHLTKFQAFVHFLSTVVTTRQREEAASTMDMRNLPTCNSCFKRDRCWGNEGQGMYLVTDQWMYKRPFVKQGMRHQLNRHIQEKCVRSEVLIEHLEELYTTTRLTSEYRHGSEMLSFQLRDVGEHVGNLLTEMEMPKELFMKEEEQLADIFKQANIDHFQLDILCNEKGARKIVVSLPLKKALWESNTMVGERLILPILQEHYDEPFQISSTKEVSKPFDHIQLTCESSIRFEYTYSIHATSTNDTTYSGDTHAVFPLHDGLLAVILSDGMGHNKAAYLESKRVIRLLRECLQYPMTPETAMHTLHYIMSLKLGTDLYATVDLALVDLQNGKLWSYKAGSMATYVFSGAEVTPLENYQAPIGMLKEMKMQHRTTTLKDGDTILFVSDGLFSPNDAIVLQEKELFRLVKKNEHYPISMMAEKIATDFQRRFGVTEDDCTVILLRIQHTKQEWSSFSPSKMKMRQRA